MGKNKSNDRGRRHTSAPTLKTKEPLDLIDLTQTAPRPERPKPVVSKPTVLTPAFGPKPCTVAVPQDPKPNPAYIFQRLALTRTRANMRPSFAHTVQANKEDNVKEGDVDRDDTPTPSHKELKEKKKRTYEENGGEKRSKGKESVKKSEKLQTKVGEEREGKEKPKEREKSRDKADKGRESKESQKEKKREAANNESQTEKKSRKRKREGDEEEQDNEYSVEVEANAILKLRESLPTVRLSRVRNKLIKETGKAPTEVAVLLTAAKDTIIDLARQQVVQTERSYQTIQSELLRMIKEQNGRLERLKGRARVSVEVNDNTSVESSDDDCDEDDDEDEDLNIGRSAKGRPRALPSW
ncbi:uncharacterized protein Z518_02591 [Rhinocladiella mackenziei CBS 650.93]|uniref:Uncharacterized protein n=1 Tax=Rhinocladiella mackenziei CBS 650.93 TaxID=1442369 RepID=A0A0D2G073_9EURO|nr:uncharacterized protein Z518_02591 [Rhinocladiella mackenziei CBS 650.93]KIX07937.1 hypothetical protein Z518_02591 [Rhinocladiella mackenziei CBS 650.93]